MTEAKFRISDERLLRSVLWADTALGGVTALIGLMFSARLSSLLGLSLYLLVVISLITLAYAAVAFTLAVQRPISVPFVRALVWANWLWTAVSVALLLTHVAAATILGLVFLVLQILVVGGLAYLEGRQIVKQGTRVAQRPT